MVFVVEHVRRPLDDRLLRPRAVNVERFLAGVEERAADLPEGERSALLERLRRG